MLGGPAYAPAHGEKSGRHGLSRAAAPRDALPLGYQTGQGTHRRGRPRAPRPVPVSGLGRRCSVSGRPLKGWRVASKGLGPLPRRRGSALAHGCGMGGRVVLPLPRAVALSTRLRAPVGLARVLQHVARRVHVIRRDARDRARAHLRTGRISRRGPHQAGVGSIRQVRAEGRKGGRPSRKECEAAGAREAPAPAKPRAGGQPGRHSPEGGTPPEGGTALHARSAPARRPRARSG